MANMAFVYLVQKHYQIIMKYITHKKRTINVQKKAMEWNTMSV